MNLRPVERKAKEAEHLKIARDTIRRLRRQFEACASARADMLHGIPGNTNIKNWTVEGSTPSKREKTRQRTEKEPVT
jgi:hypothetical protein